VHLQIDSGKVADLLKECAEKFILPRYNNLSPDQVRSKSHKDDLVTIADIETEQALETILPQMFPGCVVIGEEGVSSGKVSLDILKDPSQTIFVVDPVDGTHNFRHGKREFAVMMALVVNGETRMGWIYDVLGDVHATTEKGAGAFLGGQRMSVAQSKPLAECDAFISPGYFPKEMYPFLDSFKAEIKKIKSVRVLRCAAHEYLQLASGQADFGISGGMKPWDHLAGALMVQEAGGVVRKWDGTVYSPHDETGGLITTSGQTLWNLVHRQFLNPVLQKMSPAP
jgi:fructose-1,6-bisphosphatase/inositol monophosphatase family enzyme